MEKQIENVPGISGSHGKTVGNGGRLVIIDFIRVRGKRTIAVCQCSCGTMKNIPLLHVKSGAVKSCGCLRRETSRLTGQHNRKHGQAVIGDRGATYRSWETMKSRCFNKNDSSFYLYGGRGITVDKRWKDSFELFLLDMGERPRNTTIDRVDVNKNYNLSNCRWANPKVQQRNKRNNRMVVYQGQTVSLIELCEKTGVPYQRLYERIVRRGWATEDAVNKIPQGYY
jgi:hypothetical protein